MDLAALGPYAMTSIQIFAIRPSHLVNKYILTYDPYGPASAFFAKPLMKVPYEGRTHQFARAGQEKAVRPRALNLQGITKLVI